MACFIGQKEKIWRKGSSLLRQGFFRVSGELCVTELLGRTGTGLYPVANRRDFGWRKLVFTFRWHVQIVVDRGYDGLNRQALIRLAGNDVVFLFSSVFTADHEHFKGVHAQIAFLLLLTVAFVALGHEDRQDHVLEDEFICATRGWI
jgi:hypothetical protein